MRNLTSELQFINTNLTVDTRYVCLYLEEEVFNEVFLFLFFLCFSRRAQCYFQYTKGATFDKIYMQDGENLTR